MTAFCKHCRKLMEDDEYDQHYKKEVEPELAKRAERGGIYVTIDDEEYWGPSVEELRANGFKVVLRHNRIIKYHPFAPRMGYDIINSKGGSTYLLLLAPDGYWAEGHARCSRKDVYSKKAGYVLAVNQALSSLPGELYSFDTPFINAIEESKKLSE